MQAAVQSLYDAGTRVRTGPSEHWGILEIERQGTALVAILMGNRSIHILPPLYDVHVVRLVDEVIELRGYEKALGWHFKMWSCRRPTSHEIALAIRQSNQPLDPDFPRFVRWRPQLSEYAKNRPHPEAFLDVEEIVRLLEISTEEAMRFVEWLCETRRAYSATAGSRLGSVALKPGPHEPPPS